MSEGTEDEQKADKMTIPEWSNSTMIAQVIGKTARRVQQLTQDGILEKMIPKDGGSARYRTCETVQQYIAYVEKKAMDTGDKGRIAELSLKKLEAEVELKESQGQLHKLKTAIAEGKYLEAEEVGEELSGFMDEFKKFALNIPVRMSGTLSAYVEHTTVRMLEKALRSEIEQLLTAFVCSVLERGDKVP